MNKGGSSRLALTLGDEMTPKDLINFAQDRNILGFRKTRSESCYFCDHIKYNSRLSKSFWDCPEGIRFDDDQQGTCLMIEFKCDKFKDETPNEQLNLTKSV